MMPHREKRHFETIDKYMTPSPRTVNVTTTVGETKQLMHDFKIRHLPVMDGSRLVGLVSDGDIRLIEICKPDGAASLPVDIAMTQVPYAVTPNAMLEDVVRVMARHKYGSAVVVEGDAVVGIFTAVDALSALAWLLEKSNR